MSARDFLLTFLVITDPAPTILFSESVIGATKEELEIWKIRQGIPVLDREINGETNPYELGLGWLVNLEKEYFTGKQALIRHKENGPEKKLVGLDVEGDKPAVGSVLYDNIKKNQAKEIGIVTAAMWSPVLKSNIAIGFVSKEHYKLGSNVYAEIYHPEELDYRKIWGPQALPW